MCEVITDLEHGNLVKRAVGFFCRYLDVSPSRIFVIDKDFDGMTSKLPSHMLSAGSNILGQCFDMPKSGEYTILVRTSGRNLTEIFTTIAHEMIHARQFMTQRLAEALTDETQVNLPYLDQWWEKEALSLAPELIREFVKTIG